MDYTQGVTDASASGITDASASRNTLLTIILVLLILITGAMIFNFYGMRFQADPSNIPKCVGSDDLMLDAVSSASEKSEKSKNQEADETPEPSDSLRDQKVQQLLRQKVGSYKDGSYHPEIQQEMIKRAQAEVKKRIREKVESKAQSIEKAREKSEKDQTKSSDVKVEPMVSNAKSDKSESGKTKLCIYHMQGCGHCHDIMLDKQSNGMTKFEQLKQIFASKPEVEILDFQHGRDPEASKYHAFPVIMLVKSDTALEYNRERSVEGMAKFIIQNM